MFNQIGPFVLDKAKTTMKYGHYFKALLDVPFSKEKRYVRVWLPEDYDFDNPKKRYPVIYFSDGQNLVNKKLCAFGCWKLDIVAHDLLINKGLSFIAVGIDSPKDSLIRSLELNPPIPSDKYDDLKDSYGDKFVNYIADTLKPLIDQYFYTSLEKKDTAIGGSSMGGIMAFYAGVSRPDTFGFSLDFSPAFFLYKRKTWMNILDSFNLEEFKNNRFYFYVGGVEFEREFVYLTKLTYNYFKRNGLKDSIALSIDPKEKHHEDAWHKHLKETLLFWLDN